MMNRPTGSPTPFGELNEVLTELISRQRYILGDCLVGTYLQGSFAVGDFDEHSDVDFIVAVEDELTEARVDALNEMHDQVYRMESEWAKHLEGSYFPRDILRDYDQSGLDLWYLDHGARSMIRSSHCNSILVRWVVRENGVTLTGPLSKTLVDPIPVDALRREIYEVMTWWGQEILDNPEQFSNHFYQAFIVLTCCRMLHDLIRGFPGSKRAGAGWARENLDPRWIDLIDRAWDGRPDPASKVRDPADPEDFGRTMEFLSYVIDETRARGFGAGSRRAGGDT